MNDTMARKSVSGVVVGFNKDKSECNMTIRDGENEIGEGVFDTTKLNSILVGITDIESFLGVGTVLSAMIKSPEEKPKDEGEQDHGAQDHGEQDHGEQDHGEQDHGEQDRGEKDRGERDSRSPTTLEVLRVRPLLGKMRLNSFPPKFTKVLSYERRRYTIPGFSFSKQPLPGGEEEAPKTTVPADLVAEVICELRKQISKWNGFPIHELLNVLCNRDEFSYIQKHFSTQDDLSEFLRSYPQYFAVSEDDYAVYTMRGFKTQDLHDFLASEKIRKKSRRRDESYELIETITHCKEVVSELQDMVKRQAPLVLAIGCKGSKLRSGGPLTLLKIATMNGVAFIFDVLATEGKDNMFIEGGLKELLEDERIVKVTYDCRTEQKTLYSQFDVVLRNVFDVSIAYTVISEQCHVTARTAPKFRSARPKFSELCNIFNCGKRPKNQRAFMETMNTTKDFWSIRPLTDEMLDFAIDDVLSLVPVIYRDLDRFISPLWWPLYENRVEDTLERSKVIEPEAEEDDEDNDEKGGTASA